MLYENKVCTSEKAAECRQCIERRIARSGFDIAMPKGDNISWRKKDLLL